MDNRELVLHLEKPLSAYASVEASARDVILAGLKWPTEYWAALAVNWLEQGALIDSEITSLLHELAAKKHYSQALRHKAFAIVRRFEKSASSNA